MICNNEFDRQKDYAFIHLQNLLPSHGMKQKCSKCYQIKKQIKLFRVHHYEVFPSKLYLYMECELPKGSTEHLKQSKIFLIGLFLRSLSEPWFYFLRLQAGICYLCLHFKNSRQGFYTCTFNQSGGYKEKQVEKCKSWHLV